MTTETENFKIGWADIERARLAGEAKDWEPLMDLVSRLGQQASEECVPVPMGVYSSDLMGKQISPTQVVDEGVCGRASIIIKPATQPFVRWLKKHRDTRRDEPGEPLRDLREFNWPFFSHKHYHGGWELYVCLHSQSMARHVAFANVVLELFKAAGLKCYVTSRMD